MNTNKKNIIISFAIMMAIIFSWVEMFSAHSSEAELLIQLPSVSNSLSTTQADTLLPNSNPIKAEGVSKRVKMVITAYSSTTAQTDSTPFTTASNTTVRDGIVANNLLPFGTKIRIPELYGDKIFVVEDRMNKRKGNYHLDVWLSSTSDAKEFGSAITYVEVLNAN